MHLTHSPRYAIALMYIACIAELYLKQIFSFTLCLVNFVLFTKSQKTSNAPMRTIVVVLYLLGPNLMLNQTLNLIQKLNPRSYSDSNQGSRILNV